MARSLRWIAYALGASALCIAQQSAAVVVSGSVTLAGTANPAIGAHVRLVRFVTPFQQELVGETTIGSNGSYAFSSAASGTFQLSATLDSYLTSATSFQALDATPIVRNLALSLPSSIVIQVRDSVTLSPVPGVTVWRNPTTTGGGGSTTDSDGRVVWSNLHAGPYIVCVLDPDDAYRNECHDGVHLAANDSTFGVAPFDLASGGNVDILIELDPGASISGRLTDRYFGTPVSGPVALLLYGANGSELTQATLYPNANGDYALAGLPPGTYKLKARGWSSNLYSARLYPDIDCATACDIATGAVLALADLQAVGGIDFSLHPGAVATGSVTDAGSGSPLADAEMIAYQREIFIGWVEVSRSRTGPTGGYALSHLQASRDTQVATSVTSHVNESWPDSPCYVLPCTSGTSSQFVVDQVVGGYDFALVPGGSILGTVRDAETGAPQQAEVLIRNVEGTINSRAFSDGVTAGYRSLTLPPGTYYAAARKGFGSAIVCQQYLGLPCGSPDPIQPGIATPIVIPGAQAVTGIDFTLNEVLLRDGFEGQ